MADSTQPPPSNQSSGLQIPVDTQAKFGAIIELIKGSESMNNEERQYWINILPIMTMEQLKNLEEILTSEKKQLQAIDAKYSKQAAGIDGMAAVANMEEKIRSRKKERQQTEEQDAVTERQREEEILSKIQSF